MTGTVNLQMARFVLQFCLPGLRGVPRRDSAATEHPFEPPDTSSPRNVIMEFLKLADNMGRSNCRRLPVRSNSVLSL